MKKLRVLHLETEYDFKKLIISFCLLFGFIVFCYSIFLQTVYVESLYHNLDGLSNDDFHKFIEDAKKQIPERDNVLILNHSWFVSYYLYPRRVYFSRSLENISEDWLDKKEIKWVLSYNQETFNLNDTKIIKIR